MHVPGLVASEAMAELLAWIDDISNASTLGRHYFESTDRGRVKARTEDFAKDHPPLHQFLTQGRVHDVLEALFGEPPVLFKEKINYKHPGAAGYAPHQDAPAYPFGSLHITMLLALDSADTSNGCLEFAKGAHRNGVIDVNADGCLWRLETRCSSTPLHRTAAAPTAPIVPAARCTSPTTPAPKAICDRSTTTTKSRRWRKGASA